MFNGFGDRFGDFVIIDLPYDESDIAPKPDKANRTNLHTGVWGLFSVYETDPSISLEERKIFSDAKGALDEFVDIDELYSIVEMELPHFDEGFKNMLSWAEKIIVKNALLLGEKNA